jgi:hypothetical protein
LKVDRPPPDLFNLINRKKKAQEKCDEELNQLNKEDRELIRRLSYLEDDAAAICIQARNKFVKQQMAKEYTAGLRELQEEVDDEGVEAAGTVSSAPSRHSVTIFCVSSKAYQKSKGRFPLQRDLAGLTHVNDTGMPQLIIHCKDFTLGPRERMVNDLRKDIALLAARMRGWGNNSIPDRQITNRQKKLLKECFSDQKISHQEVCYKTVQILIIAFLKYTFRSKH